jgi:hypothetical protein
MDNPANDRYELQEFIDAGATAGFVTTRICGNDQYEHLIERRIDMLERRGTMYRLYRLQGDLKEVLR